MSFVKYPNMPNEERVEAFKQEIIDVCKAYGFNISTEDGIGDLAIFPYYEGYTFDLLEAKNYTR